MSNLAAALKMISAASLRHADVMAIRTAGATVDEDGDGAPDGEIPEPEVKSRKDSKEWRVWAVDRAKEYADTVHPRLQQKDGPPKKLRMTAKPNDILEQVGIVPALYLDFLKFGAGYCLLGMLIASVPSYILNVTKVHGAYSASTLAGYPTVFLYLCVGARSFCDDDSCKTVNTITAVCEVVYSVLLLLGTLAFRERANRLASINDANNVYTREYAVQLHGMRKDVTPDELKAHLEAVLPAKARLPADKCKVWDVALMTNCDTVLRQAVKQAPIERKWTILSRKLETTLAFKMERDTGWDINQKIGVLKDETYEAGQKLLQVRERIEKKGFKTCSHVVGAFVTFEDQPAAQACLKLYGGGALKYALQKAELRLKGRKLKAYPAAQPRDVLHENLPYRILAFDLRGLSTLLRRAISYSFLILFILVSFGTIIAVNSSKTAAQQQLATVTTLSPSLLALIDMAFPSIASLVVVGVNLSIQMLVGALGKFERHPTLSAMHRAKATTIFMAQAFNTGIVPLVVSMAPPPRAYAGAFAASCNCAGYFCCVVGPKGFLARGLHVTMTSDWHRDVGTILTSSLLIQALLALVLWLGPLCGFKAKRALLKGGVMHRYDMESLYEGPPIDLPNFIGKAYAFAFVMLMYAAVIPLMYAIGLVFFLASWLTQRFAFFNVHATPPPYSFELISTTLGWMPWAIVLHLGFAFWGFASLPSHTLDGSAWQRPFPDMKPYGSKSVLDLLATGGGAAGNYTSLAGFTTGGGALTSSVLGSLSYIYDLPAHINSLPTFILFAATLLVLLQRLLVLFRSSPLYLPLERAAGKALSAARAAVLRNKTGKVAPDGEDEVVVDPPFSQVLQGVDRHNVRELDGEILHEFQLKIPSSSSLKGRLLDLTHRLTPSALVFQALGLYERYESISKDEWKDAKPLYTKLARAADISYQPEFHPTYEKAYLYLAEPERLKVFTEANKPKPPPEGVFGAESESESDEDEDDGEEGRDGVQEVGGDTRAGGNAKAKDGGGATNGKKAENDLQAEDISDEGVDL